MTQGNLVKSCGTTLLIALLCIPLNATAATSLHIDFNTTILDTYGPSLLNKWDNVQGTVHIDGSDHKPLYSGIEAIDVMGVMLNLQVDIFQGTNTYGSASGPGWSQTTPGFAIGLAVLNDFVLPVGAMSGLPGYVTPSMFPNLPSDGDTIDAILISVASNDFMNNSAQEKTFDIGFMYNAADGVVTGPGLAGIDATQLLSSAIYGEFLAEAVIPNTDTVIWDAEGPIGAAVVPIPAAAWLFGSALIGLMGFARKRIS